jgi:hypothetical protein
MHMNRKKLFGESKCFILCKTVCPLFYEELVVQVKRDWHAVFKSACVRMGQIFSVQLPSVMYVFYISVKRTTFAVPLRPPHILHHSQITLYRPVGCGA